MSTLLIMIREPLTGVGASDAIAPVVCSHLKVFGYDASVSNARRYVELRAGEARQRAVALEVDVTGTARTDLTTALKSLEAVLRKTAKQAGIAAGFELLVQGGEQSVATSFRDGRGATIADRGSATTVPGSSID